MAKEVKKKTKNQVVEIHIYIHQVPNYSSATSQYQVCPICGRTGQHTCVTC